MIRTFQQRAEQNVTGFQSPADDYLEGRLNIADILVVDPHSTFYFQMDGEAMKTYGLHSGDLLIIDRSLTPVHGAIVIACIEGIFYCRCYLVNNNHSVLISDAGELKTTDGENLQIWGVVTSICRNTLPNTLKKGKYRRVCTL